MNLHSPVTDLKGIGEKTAVPFAKAGIHTVQDLIEYYPRAYMGAVGFPGKEV